MKINPARRKPTQEPPPAARLAGLLRRRADRQPVARGRVAQPHRQRAQPPDARAGGAAGPAAAGAKVARRRPDPGRAAAAGADRAARSEEHTSELQSLMRISYAVFCLKKKKQYLITTLHINTTY